METDQPWVQLETSLRGMVACYRPDPALENAMNTVIAVGEPLLLIGEPETGKTQAGLLRGSKGLDHKMAQDASSRPH